MDDGSVFGISEDVLLSNPLSVGMELSPIEINDLLTLEKKQNLRNVALNLLSYRMRSKAELKSRLVEKGYTDDDINPLIDDLEEKSYLNDAEFAMAFARDKVRNRRIGPRVLQFELTRHGLTQEIIEATIKHVYDEFPIEKLIKKHLDRQKITNNTHLEEKEKKRLLSFLKRKGFFWEDISENLMKYDIT